MGKALEISRYFARLKKYSAELHAMIEDGSFYRLSFVERYKLVRRVKKLYNRLLGPVSAIKLKHVIAAAGVLALNTACFVPVGVPDLRSGGTEDPGSSGGAGLPDLTPFFEFRGANPYGIMPLPGGYSFSWDDVAGTHDFRYEIPLGSFFVDLDGDGDLDVVHVGLRYSETSTYDPPSTQTTAEFTIAWQENVGTPQEPEFGPHTDFPIDNGNYAGGLAFGDMDNDGDQDMWMAANQWVYQDPGVYYGYYGPYYYGGSYNFERAGIAFFENTGSAMDPSFEFRGTYATELYSYGYGLRDVAVGDIDGDGDLDLLASGSLMVFENTGTAEQAEFDFDNPVYLGYGEFAPQVVLVDLDRDGDLDIVYTAYGEVYALENTGNGISPDWSTNIYPYGVYRYGEDVNFPQLVDIDGDGDLDVILNVPYVETDYGYSGGYGYDYYTFWDEFGEVWFFENLAVDG